MLCLKLLDEIVQNGVYLPDRQTFEMLVKEEQFYLMEFHAFGQRYDNMLENVLINIMNLQMIQINVNRQLHTVIQDTLYK